MWYAYEGENELIALKASSVKEIIEMNKRQEYPETIDEYKVELASGTAIIEGEDSAEYERELKLLADNSHDMSLQSNSSQNNDNNNQRKQQNNKERNQNRNQNQNRNKKQNNNSNNNQNRNQNQNQNNNQNRNQNNRKNRNNNQNRKTNNEQ